MLFKEIIAVCCEHCMKPLNMFIGQNSDIFNVKADGKVKGYLCLIRVIDHHAMNTYVGVCAVSFMPLPLNCIRGSLAPRVGLCSAKKRITLIPEV
jgi:hypothetical protein